MQDKIDKLTDILKTVRSEHQKNYALTLLADIVHVINDNSKQYKALAAFKTNNNYNDVECELEKYVCILIFYGFSQKLVNTIRVDGLRFIAKYKEEFIKLNPSEFKLVDLHLMGYELEKGFPPKDFESFKKYYDNAKG